jgi:hypothetical protein
MHLLNGSDGDMDRLLDSGSTFTVTATPSARKMKIVCVGADGETKALGPFNVHVGDKITIASGSFAVTLDNGNGLGNTATLTVTGTGATPPHHALEAKAYKGERRYLLTTGSFRIDRVSSSNPSVGDIFTQPDPPYHYTLVRFD